MNRKYPYKRFTEQYKNMIYKSNPHYGTGYTMCFEQKYQ